MGDVRRTSPHEPLRVAFETEAPAPRWLFVSEKWYPGWVAEIDGEPAPVHRANVGFRAVRVPEGRCSRAPSARC